MLKAYKQEIKEVGPKLRQLKKEFKGIQKEVSLIAVSVNSKEISSEKRIKYYSLLSDVQKLKLRARYLNIIYGFMKGYPIEKIERNPKEPHLEKWINWIKEEMEKRNEKV